MEDFFTKEPFDKRIEEFNELQSQLTRDEKEQRKKIVDGYARRNNIVDIEKFREMIVKRNISPITLLELYLSVQDFILVEIGISQNKTFVKKMNDIFSLVDTQELQDKLYDYHDSNWVIRKKALFVEIKDAMRKESLLMRTIILFTIDDTTLTSKKFVGFEDMEQNE